jgi:hypothetical protein
MRMKEGDGSVPGLMDFNVIPVGLDRLAAKR